MLDITPFKRTGSPDLFREMEQLAKHFWHDFPFRDIKAGVELEWAPRVDIVETDKAVEVHAELPGMEKKDIEITLDRDLLTIKGEKKIEKEEKDRHYHRIERHYGTFYRTVRLPVEVDEKKIDAAFKDGVLTVTLPRAEGETSGVKHIDIH